MKDGGPSGCTKHSLYAVTFGTHEDSVGALVRKLRPGALLVEQVQGFTMLDKDTQGVPLREFATDV